MSVSDFFKQYFNHSHYLVDNDSPHTLFRLETRTRRHDVTDALRFRVYDPLWMLSRQWQMGEFRGNDAGTAMSVRARVKTTPIEKYQLGKDGGRTVSAGADTPLEPLVEQIDREITPQVRVESAIYFLDLLNEAAGLSAAEKSLLTQSIMANQDLALDRSDLSMPRSSVVESDVTAFTNSRNTRLTRFKAACVGKIFDGYKLYQQRAASVVLKPATEKKLKKLLDTYCSWFKDRYLPASAQKGAWDTPSLGHHFKAENACAVYTAEDYAGGRVSWYSFDLEKKKSGSSQGKVQEMDVLPTLASYPGAPNKRLWQFEDRKVFMGNSIEMQAKGNIAFLQYATMYGNDWMLFPLKTEVGKYVEVESITVYDTFGIPVVVKGRAGKNDKGAKTFGQKWQMFSNAPVDQESSTAASADGLLFPPALVRTLEGAPVEEVNFLRDEMANMLWGVETRLDDGCGSSLDASLLASDVQQHIEEKYQDEVERAHISISQDDDGKTVVKSSREAEYKYSLMNSVPLNWIPFVPQHIKIDQEKKLYQGFLGGREVAFRRGVMPCYVVTGKQKGSYFPVRPQSSFLKPKKVVVNGKLGDSPLFINEEQIQGVGTLIVKNCQRSRWIGGKTYTWMGYSKQIKHTQGVSGLEFDTLKDAAEK